MRKHVRAVPARCLLVLTLVCCLFPGASVAASMATRPGPGAAGAGDAYFPRYGNGGYDVTRYDIHVRYRPRTHRLIGRTTVTARASQGLTRFNLDLVLQPSEVRVNGRPAEFTHRRHELTVHPASPLVKGSTFRVLVAYAGTPAAISFNRVRPWLTAAGGAVAAGEPEIAAWWFPGNDHPSDKARYTVAITAPRSLQAISNGTLAHRRRNGATTTWSWRMRQPMASYLAFLAIGHYDLETGTAGGLPYLYAFDSGLGSDGARARRAVRRTPSIARWLESVWGPYPFRQLGGVVLGRNTGFALENQTRPVYPNNLLRTDGTRLVAHELSHQWFGDAVSIRKWRDVWLNEGPATYSEWLWQQHRGLNTPQQIFLDTYRLNGARSSLWDVKIGDPGPRSLFSWPIYDRSAMTLQALRNRVGNTTFFAIMRGWVHGRRGGNGSTRQFIAYAQRLSGQRLARFFHTWLFSTGRPANTTANGLPGRRP